MPEVAVVTRTRDRPLLLPRARRSVSEQSFRDLVWVIVNDGGDPEHVNREAEVARADGVITEVVHTPSSRGMEAASNAGVEKVNSRYVSIHDDDETWESSFLERTCGWLKANADHVGVVTAANTVIEKIEGQKVTLVRQSPPKKRLEAVHLADLLCANLFPPICLLYRRAAYDQIGGYDETMKVLGDWKFNIELLLNGDVGVINEPLANYHVRRSEAGVSDAYANSVVAALDDHRQYDAIFRNRELRKDVASGRFGLGTLLAIGRIQSRGRKSAGRQGLDTLKSAMRVLFNGGR